MLCSISASRTRLPLTAYPNSCRQQHQHQQQAAALEQTDPRQTLADLTGRLPTTALFCAPVVSELRE